MVFSVCDKVALLIGNKDYVHYNELGKLYQPTNDVRDIAGVLQSIGFKVYYVLIKYSTLQPGENYKKNS